MKGIDAREIFLAIAAFLAGVTTAYASSADKTGANGAWIAWLMGGLSSLGTGVAAYAVTNPRLQPRTPEALLEAVRQTPLPPVVKAAAAEALGAVIVTEAAAPAKETKVQ